MKQLVPLLLFGLFLFACSATTPAADSTSVHNEPTPEMAADLATVASTATAEPAAPTAVPTAAVGPTIEAEPTITVEPTAVPATVTGQPAAVNGRNDDGTFYRGAANAPITIVEYSDFL